MPEVVIPLFEIAAGGFGEAAAVGAGLGAAEAGIGAGIEAGIGAGIGEAAAGFGAAEAGFGAAEGIGAGLGAAEGIGAGLGAAELGGATALGAEGAALEGGLAPLGGLTAEGAAAAPSLGFAAPEALGASAGAGALAPESLGIGSIAETGLGSLGGLEAGLPIGASPAEGSLASAIGESGAAGASEGLGGLSTVTGGAESALGNAFPAAETGDLASFGAAQGAGGVVDPFAGIPPTDPAANLFEGFDFLPPGFQQPIPNALPGGLQPQLIPNLDPNLDIPFSQPEFDQAQIGGRFSQGFDLGPSAEPAGQTFTPAPNAPPTGLQVPKIPDAFSSLQSFDQLWGADVPSYTPENPLSSFANQNFTTFDNLPQGVGEFNAANTISPTSVPTTSIAGPAPIEANLGPAAGSGTAAAGGDVAGAAGSDALFSGGVDFDRMFAGLPAETGPGGSAFNIPGATAPTPEAVAGSSNISTIAENVLSSPSLLAENAQLTLASPETMVDQIFGGTLTPGAAPPGAGVESLASAPSAGSGAGPIVGTDVGAGSPLSGGVTTPATAGPVPGGGGVMDFLQKNPLLVGGLGLAGAAGLSGLSTSREEKAVQAAANAAARQAKALSSEGAELRAPLRTGTLPAGQEAAVQNALKDAKNTVRAKYASLGLGGSTMESDAIANLDNQIPSIRANIEQQMAATGTALAGTAATNLGLEANIYTTLLNNQIARDTALATSIARFAAASALGQGSSAAKMAVVS